MSDDKIVPLDPGFPISVYEELASMDVQLDADPLQFGPKRLNGKIALTRKHLSRAGALLLEASRLHAYYKRAHRRAEVILEFAKKDLLANDPETRAGRAVSEREAIATGKLKDETEDVYTCEYAVEELDAVIRILRAKQSDLKDIQGRIRDQMKICAEEIGLGQKWGSKVPAAPDLVPGQGFATAADVEAMEDVIDSVRGIRMDDDDDEVHQEAEVTDGEIPVYDASLAAQAVVRPDGAPILVEVEVETPPDNLTLLMDAQASSDEDAPTAAEVLPGASSREDVKDFLQMTMPEPSQGRKARMAAESEALDIESLLDSL